MACRVRCFHRRSTVVWASLDGSAAARSTSMAASSMAPTHHTADTRQAASAGRTASKASSSTWRQRASATADAFHRGAKRASPRPKGCVMSGVLSGVRVVELASWTYVPAAGAALSDWGADVIKVEGVSAGDPGRSLVVGGFTREAARVDADFILELGNRGKRSIAIDIKSETGRQFFGRLLANTDGMLAHCLPAALERARLTVDDIRAFNPTIIIARGTGTGVRGPDRNRGGSDAATYLARGGGGYN